LEYVGFDGDIYAQSFRGLGRGRGFAVVARDSILGDHAVVELIASRILRILHVLLERDLLSVELVVAELGIPDVVDDDVIRMFIEAVDEALTPETA
jgi:hypothetical protein